MIRNNIITYAAILEGSLLVLVAVVGFCLPNFLGLKPSPLLNLAHLAFGLMALYFGLKCPSLTAARSFCWAVGSLYSLGGVAGFVFPGLGNTLLYSALGAGFVAAALMQPLPSTIYSSR